MTKKLMIASRRHIVSEGMSLRLGQDVDSQVEYWAETENQLIESLQELRPDVLILCSVFCGKHTPRLIRRLSGLTEPVNILIISGKVDRQSILEAMEAGATGYISLVHSGFDELMMAVRSVANGKSYICQKASESLLGGLFSDDRQTNSNKVLSQREEQIVRLVANGASSKEIAQKLAIAPSTVDVHRRNLMKKIGAHNTADITRYALSKELVHS